MEQVLLCSMAVPWPSRPQLGIYHHLQAEGLRELGVRTSLFSPAPCLPALSARFSRRAREQLGRPRRYRMRGVETFSPRVPFAFPPVVRRMLSSLAPSAVGAWAERALGPALDEVLEAVAPDLLLAHGAMPFGPLVSRRAERRGIAHAYIEHSADDVLRLRRRSALGRFYRRHYERAELVFTPSPLVLDHLRHELGLENARRIENGAVRPTVEQLRTRRPTELEDRTVLLSAAQWSPRKGLELLVEAFERIARSRPELVLILFCNAPPSLRRRIEAGNAEGRIQLRPLVGQSELIQWMVWSDLFVLPSWRESFGLVYAEALAAGTPVVLGEDSGFAPFVVDGRQDPERGQGWKVAPRDLDSLVGALEDAVSDRERLARLGANGPRLLARRFRWLDNARALRDELEAATRGRPARELATLRG